MINEQIFPVEAFGHDERSTRFANGGHCDSLVASDYKQPIIVAYAIENHPCDSRVTMTTNGIVQTLNARMGTGGGNVPLVLMQEASEKSCFAIDSHPMDSRINIAGSICPGVTTKLAKLASDGPLILIKEK